MLGDIGKYSWPQYLRLVIRFCCVVSKVDATRSVDEVFTDVCAIFGDLPKLERRKRKKGKDLH